MGTFLRTRLRPPLSLPRLRLLLLLLFISSTNFACTTPLLLAPPPSYHPSSTASWLLILISLLAALSVELHFHFYTSESNTAWHQATLVSITLQVS